MLAEGRTYSFEFFPPKTDEGRRHLARALVELQPLEPSFVSVTYRGGPSSREPTHDLVAGMLKTTTLNPMAHVTCVGHTRLELADILVQLRKAGIDNLMALGGDPPAPGVPQGELRYAQELVELARAIGGFSIGVAAHPSVHPRAASREADRAHLAAKLRLADFAVTQSVFSVREYVSLVEDLAALGVDKPVLPGIMPITALSSIDRQRELGAVVPDDVEARLRAARREADVRAVGIELATELCAALLDAGAPGLHFITLNRSSATREIYGNLGIVASAA
ncbi:5,10-methylenetetrahydrofolate reductase [Acidimicrobiaceae bacterium USS-CC1]|uniref:Methylenetetrahydrofolate reductase n=1 Tax=Acidiferrimicrobium australe TaxID=2664430 RepID=A0ABW9QTZ8_9ACTN|nr:5,10-methylenetetrahydrofolate reductase [Acidiferrimicrobium australe]